MNFDFKWTQSKIVKILVLVIILYVTIGSLIILIKGFPPLITNAEIEKSDNNSYTVLIKGKFPPKDSSSKIIIDTSPLNNNNILSWSDKKVSILLPNQSQKVRVIQIKHRNGTSNKHILVLSQGKGTEGILNDDELIHPRKNTKPLLNTITSLRPYDILEFSGISGQRYAYLIKSNNLLIHLPNYLARHQRSSDKELQLILPDYLWFSRRDQIELNIQSLNETYAYTLNLFDIFQNSRTQEIHYTIQASFSAIGEHLYIIPMSTSYQNTNITEDYEDPLIIDGNFLHVFLNQNQISFNSWVLSYKIGSESLIPLDFKDNYPLQLEYLLQVQNSKDNKMLGSYFKELNSPPSKTQVNSQSSSNQVNFRSYLDDVYNFGIEANETDELEEIGLIENLQSTYNSFLNSNKLVKKHIAISAFLRSKSIIARTIIGIDVDQFISSPPSVTNRLTSWIEILNSNEEWIPIPYTLELPIRQNHISLFEYERYYKKTLELIYPVLPKITSIVRSN